MGLADDRFAGRRAALYLFRGKEPDGTATLSASRPTVTADAVVRVDAAAGNWVATTRFALTVTGGGLPTAVVFVPGAHAPRAWKLIDDANAITDATPVPRELFDLFPLFVPLDARAGVVGARSRRPGRHVLGSPLRAPARRPGGTRNDRRRAADE